MGWMKTLNQWLGHGGVAATVTPNVGAAEASPPSAADADPADRPWGCGWLDSSLDLRQGLAVIEHAGIDLGLALEMMMAPEGVALQ